MGYYRARTISMRPLSSTHVHGVAQPPSTTAQPHGVAQLYAATLYRNIGTHDAVSYGADTVQMRHYLRHVRHKRHYATTQLL